MTLAIVLAAVFATLLCAVAHWVTEILSHGQMSRPARYALGVLAVGVPFTGLCLVEGVAAWVVAAFWAIAAGAGVGTCLAYLVDWVAGMRRAAALMEGRHGESGATRDAVR